MPIKVRGPKISFQIPVFGGIDVTETVIIQWIVMIIIMGLVFWLTYGLKKKPSKKQAVAEMIVNAFNDMVDKSMGKKNRKYAPYIATLFMFILFGSLISLTGLRSGTADINVTMTYALVTFIMITYTKFKSNGFFGYFKSYAEPIAVMTPMNIISEFSTPISMGFRLFGNMAGGMIITMMIHAGLNVASSAIGFSIPVLEVGIPALLSIYFDLFVGFIQSYVFIMLTMAYIGNATAD